MFRNIYKILSMIFKLNNERERERELFVFSNFDNSILQYNWQRWMIRNVLRNLQNSLNNSVLSPSRMITKWF